MFYLSIVFLSRSSQFLEFESCKSHVSRGEQIDLGQPIVAALPDGVPPGCVGFRSSKAPADCLAYRAVGRVSFDVSCGASPPVSRVHVTCSCVNTLLGDSAGDEALNSLQPILATRERHRAAAIYNILT